MFLTALVSPKLTIQKDSISPLERKSQAVCLRLLEHHNLPRDALVGLRLIELPLASFVATLQFATVCIWHLGWEVGLKARIMRLQLQLVLLQVIAGSRLEVPSNLKAPPRLAIHYLFTLEYSDHETKHHQVN